MLSARQTPESPSHPKGLNIDTKQNGECNVVVLYTIYASTVKTCVKPHKLHNQA